MTIAYPTRNKAEKAGIVLSDDAATFTEYKDGTKFKRAIPAGAVRAFYPKYGLVAYGIGATALEEMIALVRIKSHDDSRVIVTYEDDPFTVAVFNADRTKTPYRGHATPSDAYAEILKLDQAKKPWLSTVVPEDGGEAYKQGFMADDNPWIEADDEEDAESAQKRDIWDEAFDAAIEADEGEDEISGSVVKQVYRLRYAEAGHPAHCGDWLAETLNNLVLGKTQTDIDNFEALCNLNGVSLAKYKREGTGWQGRLRMTGRNLLARIVFSTGVLKVTTTLAELIGLPKGKEGVLNAPKEWLDEQNFKTKKAATTLAEGRATQAAKTEPVPDVKAQMAAIKKAKGKK